MKKVCAVILWILLLFFITGCEESKDIRIMEKDGFYYRHKFGEDNTKAEILGYYGDDVTSLVIPETIDNMTVVSVKGDELGIFLESTFYEVHEFEFLEPKPAHSFSNCKGLTSIIIADSVTTIGKEAFSGCVSLQSVTIPEGVTEIGEGAFRYCGLTSITIPDSVVTIGNGAFSLCKNLQSATIPTGVIEIGEYAFSDCINLTIYSYPNSYIKRYAEEHGINYVEM